jgi:hypothetical protein
MIWAIRIPSILKIVYIIVWTKISNANIVPLFNASVATTNGVIRVPKGKNCNP